jgi:hypothetical protein
MTAAQLFTDSGKCHDVDKGAKHIFKHFNAVLWAFGETTACLAFLSKYPV